MQQNVVFCSTTLHRVDIVFIKTVVTKKSSQQCLWVTVIMNSNLEKYSLY